MKEFTVTFSLSEAEEKALLTQHNSIQEMITNYINQQINSTMKHLVRLCANGGKPADLTEEDKLAIETADTRLIRNIEDMPKEAMEIIVNKIKDDSEVIVEEVVK